MTPTDPEHAAPRGRGSADGADDASARQRVAGDGAGEGSTVRDDHRANGAGVSAPASSPAAFGAERCPTVWVSGATPTSLGDVAPVGWVELARVGRASAPGRARPWRLAGVVDQPTDALLAADRDDAPLRATVYGTREGDRWSGPVSLDTLAPGPGDVWGVDLAVGDTAGTIFRWWATGCLACRDSRGCST